MLGVLLLIEVVLVVIFDIAAVADPGPQGLSLHAFNPDTLTGAGIGTALCFCVAAFLGFEQAPVYAEETSRPHVLVPRVMFLAVGGVAVFFTISCWAYTVAAGPSAIVGTAQEQSAGLLFFLTEDLLGTSFTDVLHVLFVTGMFAAMLSFHNVVARYAFAMGREGLLPAAFGRTSGASGAPGTGSLLQTAVISLVVVAAFAFADDKPTGDPTAPVLHLFTWCGNIGALGVTAADGRRLGLRGRLLRPPRAAGAQVWRLAASGLAGVALLVIVVYTVKDFDVLIGAGPDSALSWVLPGVIALALAVGLVQGLLLRSRAPEPHARIGLGNEAFQLEKAATETSERGTAPESPVRSGYGTLTSTRDSWSRPGRGCSNGQVNPEQPAAPEGPEERGEEGRKQRPRRGASPIGRRVLLGILGLGALGVVAAPTLQRGLESFLGERVGQGPHRPDGPAAERRRLPLLLGRLLRPPQDRPPTYRLTVDGLVDRPRTYTLAELRGAAPDPHGARRPVRHGLARAGHPLRGRAPVRLLDAAGVRPAAGACG